MQEIELEPFDVVGDHSQMVKAPTISKGYGSKDCVNLPLSTAVSRINMLNKKTEMDSMDIFQYPLSPFILSLRKMT